MDSASQGLVNFLILGVVVLLAVLAVFEILRRVSPATYYFRESAAERPEWVDYDGTPPHALPRPSNAPLSWLVPTLQHDEEQLMKTHGLDAAFFLRYLRMMCYMFTAIGLLFAATLMPIYGTGTANALAKRKFDLAANATAAAANGTAVNGTATLSNATASNSAKVTLVEGVALISLANVAEHDWWRLTITLLSEILIVLAVAYLIRRELGLFLQKRLDYRADSKRNPSNYAVVVLDVPADKRTEEEIRAFFTRCFPGDVAAVHHVRSAAAIGKCKTKLVGMMKARECCEYSLQKAAAVKPDANHAKLEAKLATALDKQRGKEQELKDLMGDLDASAPFSHAAIVLFNNKRSATLAANTPLWNKASEWKVERAAEPRGVNWNKLGVSKHVAFITQVIVTVALTALIIFYFIPMAFVQSLASIEALSNESYGRWLKGWVESENEHAKRVLTLIEGMLPQIVLAVFLALIPIVVRLAVSFERIPDMGRYEKKVRNYVCAFLTVSGFLYVVLAGSVLSRINELRNSPTIGTVVVILGTTIPEAATLLMGYILFNAFVGFPVTLLNVGRLIMRPVFMRLGAPTERKKLAADANGIEFPYYSHYGRVQFIGFTALVYANIAPLILPVAAIYFGVAFVACKFLLMYAMVPSFEMGGLMYPGAWYCTLIALYVHQLSLVGILALKKAHAHSAIMLVVFFATLSLLVYLRKTYTRITQCGSLLDQVNADNEAGIVDKVPGQFVDWYVNPGVKPLEEWEAKDLTGTPPEVGKAAEYDKDIPELEDGSKREREVGFSD